jgi:hypothetical protein
MSVSGISLANPFTSAGPLGLSITSIVGGSGTVPSTAASIVASGNADTSGGPLSLLSSPSTVTQSPTIAALTSGQLTNGQHKVIQAIGQSPGGQTTVPWNANGSEPSQLTSLRQLGWLKLVKPINAPNSSQINSGVYKLTPVGEAIFKRTVGGTIGVDPTAADTPGSGLDTAAITASLGQSVQTVASLLSAVGVNVTV